MVSTNTTSLRAKAALTLKLFFLLLPLPAFSQSKELSPYEKRYRSFMTGPAPLIENASQGLEFPDVIYLNRHLPEFVIVAWNFEPAPDPIHFEESIEPIKQVDLEHLYATNTDGFIVVQNEKILQEYYALGMERTTRHAAFSCGKSWTSAIWGDTLLPAASKQVEEILPEFKDSIYQKVTVRDLWDMRVPIEWTLDYDDPDSQLHLQAAMTGWDYVDPGLSLHDLVKRMQKSEDSREKAWNYVSPNTLLLEKIGRSLSKEHPYARMNRFYRTLGMEYMSSTTANFYEESSAQGGQSFTLRDFVKLPCAMAQDGKLGGRTVFSKAYVRNVMEPDPTAANSWASRIFETLRTQIFRYRNHWYIIDRDIAMGIGSFGQFMVFNRSNGVAIAKFSTYPKGEDYFRMYRDINWLIEKSRSYPTEHKNHKEI